MKPKPRQRGPSNAFELIAKDAHDFVDLVEWLSKIPGYNAATYKDAYGRMNRVWNRYDEQKNELTPSERGALKKVLEDDNFTKYVLSIRVIADHRTNRRGAKVPLRTRGSHSLSEKTSAAALFRDRRVAARTGTNQIIYVDHLDILQQMAENLRNALTRAIELPDN